MVFRGVKKSAPQGHHRYSSIIAGKTQLGQWKNTSVDVATVTLGGEAPTAMEKNLTSLEAVRTLQDYTSITSHSIDMTFENYLLE